jgi:hypothetical protein
MKHEFKEVHNTTRLVPAYHALLPFTKPHHFPSCPTRLPQNSGLVSSLYLSTYTIKSCTPSNQPPYHKLTSMKPLYLMALHVGALVSHCAATEELSRVELLDTAFNMARVSGSPLNV